MEAQMNFKEYYRIAGAIQYIRDNADRHPEVDEIAASVRLSSNHFTRLFRQWAGISPKRYLEEITISKARILLGRYSVFDASLELGLSGPSRLHDHFVTIEALSPGEFKDFGKNVSVRMGRTESPFGKMLIAFTDRGVHLMAFYDSEPSLKKEMQRLHGSLPRAHFVEDPQGAQAKVDEVFRTVLERNAVKETDKYAHKNIADSGKGYGKERSTPGLEDKTRESKEGLKKNYLSVRGTNFQIQVWRALLRVPDGSAISYQQLANEVGRPKAVRAATAVANNPVNYLIPCHRVIRSDGSLGGFRGGTIRKEILLLNELKKSL